MPGTQLALKKWLVELGLVFRSHKRQERTEYIKIVINSHFGSYIKGRGACRE